MKIFIKVLVITTISFVVSVNMSVASDLPDCPVSGYFHDCFGTRIFDNGDEYVGEFKDDTATGYGILKFGSNSDWAGDEYVGEFKDNKRNGFGIYTTADGTVYEGDWKVGEITGEGIATYSNGDTYEGAFVNGRRQGQGTIKFANGRSAEGDWQDGELLDEKSQKKSFSDFDIGGIFLYDNLLDHLSSQQIKEFEAKYPNHYAYLNEPDLFKTIVIDDTKRINDKYRLVEINFKYENGAPIVHGLRGSDFYGNIDLCHTDLKKISENIAILSSNINKDGPYTNIHPADPTGASTYLGTNFINQKNDFMHVVCYDWSEQITKTNNWNDNLSFGIFSEIVGQWLNNEL